MQSIATVFFSMCVVYATTLILCVSNPAIAEDEPSSTLVDNNKTELVVEEILRQITALRREVGALRTSVNALNSKMEALPAARPVAKAPAPERVELGEFLLGDKNASYAIVEFTDYQCSFCSRHNKNVYPQIKKELIDTCKVQYVVRDYPLRFHASAKGAAVAARCAGAQGRYWAMHEVLFANQRSLNETLYTETATSLGLNEETFASCLDDPNLGRLVDRDFAYGGSVGVTGTPTFFVGKIKGDAITDVVSITGAQSYSAFSSALQQLSQ